MLLGAAALRGGNAAFLRASKAPREERLAAGWLPPPAPPPPCAPPAPPPAWHVDLQPEVRSACAHCACACTCRVPCSPVSRCPDVPMSRCTQPMCMARAGRDRGHLDPNPNPTPTPNVQGAVEAILAAPSRRDASVAPLPHTRGGPSAATARWRAYVRGGGLRSYASHRNNPLATAGKGGRRTAGAHRAAAWTQRAAAWIAAWIHRAAVWVRRVAACMRRVAASTTTTTHRCRR